MDSRFLARPGALAAALAGLLGLSACVSVPQGPTVAVMPGAGKTLDQFNADISVCQQYAQSAVAGPTHAAQNYAASNAVGGAALGAVLGAMLGAVTGQAGAGAAWGAGTGLLYGGAAAGNAGAASSYTLQRQFDIAYMQCMYAHGDQVPGRVVQRNHPPVSYSATVPRSYSAPSNAGVPPPGTPAPARTYNAPPNAGVPPPDTPPPQGLGGADGLSQQQN